MLFALPSVKSHTKASDVWLSGHVQYIDMDISMLVCVMIAPAEQWTHKATQSNSREKEKEKERYMAYSTMYVCM